METNEVEKPETPEPVESADIHSLDDAALDAQLASDDEGTPAEPEEKPEEKSEEPETPTEEKPEVKDQPVLDAEKLAKQAADKEAFIQRQAAEIGELRKQAELLQQQLASIKQDDIDALYDVSPAEAVNKVLEIREQQAQMNRLHMLATVKQNEATTKQYVPDFDELMPDIAATLKELKYDDDSIRSFQQSPYETNPLILVNLAERSRLAKENRTLKAEIETLKKAPEVALKKVEQAARQVVTGATGKTGGGALTAKQVHQMSIAEIEAALNEPD